MIIIFIIIIIIILIILIIIIFYIYYVYLVVMDSISKGEEWRFLTKHLIRYILCNCNT